MSKVFTHRDTGIEIVAGNVAGQSGVNKFGSNPSIGALTETVWDQGGLYAYIPTATVLKISSTSASDTSAGVGAQTVQVFGLDADWNEINELVTLTGQTASLTTNLYLRVFRLIVRSAGATKQNLGVIYAGTGLLSGGIPPNKYAIIIAGENQTLMALYTVPAGKTGYIKQVDFSAGEGKSAHVSLTVREFGEVFAIKRHWELFQNVHQQNFAIPLEAPEKSDIEMQAQSAAAGVHIGAGFDIVLRDNE